MIKLIETIESAISGLAQEFPRDASVLVQFAAGDWAAIKSVVAAARKDWDASQKHDIADAAGVVSHTSGGQPIPADERLDNALGTMPDGVAADVAPPAPVEVPATDAVAQTGDSVSIATDGSSGTASVAAAPVDSTQETTQGADHVA